MLDDLDDTAGLMKALALVLCAQTAVSAQAGALGVPCWQLSAGADWTALGAEHSPWYPAMRCFRRRWGQSWSGIIESIAGELRRNTAAPSGTPHQPNDGVLSARMLNERGLSELKNGLPDEAAASFARAIELQHDFADAHHNLGRVYLARGHAADAADCFYLATHFAPALAPAHLDLGVALCALDRTEQAMDALNHALELDPGLDDAHVHLAGLYKAKGDLNLAVTHYRRAVEISPDSAEVHCNLGYALFRLGRYDEAEAHYATALRNRRDFAEAHHNLGLLFLHRGEPERALAYLGTAHASKPRLPETVSCMGHALRDLGRYDEALARYDEALAIRPDFGDAVLNRCYIYLALGNCEDGWREYEKRFAATGAEKRDFPHPVWCGENLAGKTILAWGEQGIGDQIMFAGVLPDLIERAGSCIIECSAKLVPLFARSFADAHVVVKSDPPHPATARDIGYQIAAGSLPLHLRRELRDFPVHDGYLIADAQRVARWRERLAALGGGLKVGICWRSSNQKGERALEYTSLSQWGPIFAVPGIHFVNLQYDECVEELAQARGEFGVTLHHFSEVDMMDDLDETAGLMKALDLVISAQTAMSAQAGALGVPCWQIGAGADWTALGAEHSPWYPAMRCFRRRWGQSWSDIIESIAGELRSTAPVRV